MIFAPAGRFVPMFTPPRNGKRSARVGWIIAENGCHIWQGKDNNKGYGQVVIDGRHRLVHRVRYELEVGPIPKGMQLDHFACDNRMCCNPAHLRPATNRENTLRGRMYQLEKTHCPQGHAYSGDNLISREGGRWRGCRACTRAAAARSYARRAKRQPPVTVPPIPLGGR